MKKVIILTGPSGVGKNHFADNFKKDHPNEKVHFIAFATYLKGLLFDNYPELANMDKEEYRHLLIEYGDKFRSANIDFFVNIVKDTIKAIGDETDYIIITDARFDNEVATVKKFISNCNYELDKCEKHKLDPKQHATYDHKIECECLLIKRKDDYTPRIKEELKSDPSEAGIDSSLVDRVVYH